MQSGLFVITLGDPLSINVNAILMLLPKFLAKTDPNTKVLLVGSFKQWQHQSSKLGFEKLVRQEDVVEPGHGLLPEKITFWDIALDIKEEDPLKLTPAERGLIMFRSLEALKKLPMTDKIAVLTCPINKSLASMAGFKFPGQTEFFADLWQADSIMILAGPKLRVGLVTNHVALNKVAESINTNLIVRKLELFSGALLTIAKDSLIKTIAVAGLNPHASDKGLFGDEEEKFIAPAVNLFNQKNTLFRAEGPFAADTIFYRAMQGEFCAVLSMYHDQGLGPLKTVHFYDAVNITGGLNHFRVSPDHGPASDLYLKGLANFQSFEQCFIQCLLYLR